jgi:hypothetical protein
MKTRNSALCALGLAAAITLGGALTAAAQDTTRARPQTRIPVRKDQPVVAPPRVDTVTVTRTDTVVRTRTDTVTVTRVDTVTRIEELPLQPLGTWQFGVAVGWAAPTGDWRNVVKDGYDLHAHLGWFPGANVFGIRLNGDYFSMGGREDDCPACPGAKGWNLGGDVVLRFPLDRKSPVNPQIYFLGGGGWTWFNDFTPYRTTERPPQIVTAGDATVRLTGTQTGAAVVISNTALADESSSKAHWDFGGGVQLANFFIESKYVSINTEGKRSVYVPTRLGYNWHF